MPSPKLYRDIAVADLPDADWVADQAVAAGVVNVYSLWPGRAAIEMTAVWWDIDTAPTGVGAAVYDAAVVEIQPIEIKRVAAEQAIAGVSAFTAIVNATSSISRPAFEKQSLTDSSPDEMYLRIVAATPPFTATHLRLIAEVTA